MQIIFHIDLNSFFASAEIARNQQLKGKPIVICRDNPRSVITTASYEARKFGINSAMPLFMAKEKYAKIIVINPDFAYYKKLSKSFFEIIKTYSPYLEVASIDECYVDVTEYIQKSRIDPRRLAAMIQNKVLDELKLPCSIGIAPNMFLAKMASDLKKPLGITVINKCNYQEKLWNLPIKSMYGIGKKTQPKLIDQGIKTIGDIANYHNFPLLKSILGNNALIFFRHANGIDSRKVQYQESLTKSIGNSVTFEKNSNDEGYIVNRLSELARNVSARAKKHKVIGNNISITIKYADFKTVTRQTIINDYTNNYDKIISTAKYLFEENFTDQYVRLVGVSLNNVISEDKYFYQLSIFKQDNKTEDIVTELIKKMNKNGDKVIRASDLLKE